MIILLNDYSAVFGKWGSITGEYPTNGKFNIKAGRMIRGFNLSDVGIIAVYACSEYLLLLVL